MEIALITPRFTLVPTHFFDPSQAREALGEVVTLMDTDEVRYVDVPHYDAVLVYAEAENDSKDIESEGCAGLTSVLPEIFYILRALPSCPEYNKILASFREGFLYLAIAQGGRLLLCNSFRCSDFTTAEYFIFSAMKSLQLNPEVSTICWRGRIGDDDQMSLYRYFKSVEQL